jgi:hypothetical protein
VFLLVLTNNILKKSIKRSVFVTQTQRVSCEVLTERYVLFSQGLVCKDETPILNWRFLDSWSSKQCYFIYVALITSLYKNIRVT